MSNIIKLLGLTLVSCERQGEQVHFETSGGQRFRVFADDPDDWAGLNVTGDLSDLVGKPILQAEEVTGDDWAFYKLGTIKGRVTLDWVDGQNGAYRLPAKFE